MTRIHLICKNQLRTVLCTLSSFPGSGILYVAVNVTSREDTWAALGAVCGAGTRGRANSRVCESVTPSVGQALADIAAETSCEALRPAQLLLDSGFADCAAATLLVCVTEVCYVARGDRRWLWNVGVGAPPPAQLKIHV